MRDILVRAGCDVDHDSFDKLALYYDEEVGGSVAPLEPFVPLRALSGTGRALIVDSGVFRLR